MQNNPTLLRLDAVCKKTGFSKSHIWRLISAKQFPQPVPIGPSSRAFVESEVNEWITARIAERDQKGAS